MQFDDQTNSGLKNDDIPTNSSIYSLVLPDLGLVWPFETMRGIFGGVQNPDHPRGSVGFSSSEHDDVSVIIAPKFFSWKFRIPMGKPAFQTFHDGP